MYIMEGTIGKESFIFFIFKKGQGKGFKTLALAPFSRRTICILLY